ncbi:MAG: replicative DNA helicase [Thermodesulfobacteriota bacterium]|nr:replicative DNA helicase [Thermodesulfobacteriota bacterium]
MDNATPFLPYNKDAEEYILGGVLLENSSLDTLSDQVSSDDFYSERNRIIYECMQSLHDKGLPVDIVSLPDALESSGRLEKAGGVSYIASIAERIPTSANIEYYAVILRDKSILRSLINGASEIVKNARVPMGDVSDVLGKAEQIIFDINKEVKNAKSGLIKAGTLLPDIYRNLTRLHKGEMVQGAVPTPFTDMNHTLMGGLHSTDLIILAARPAMGKSSLAMNIAQHVAVVERMPVAVFSLEMGKEQLAMRMLASEARIDQTKVRTAMLKDDEWGLILDASDILSDAPLYIDDTAGITPAEIRAKLRRLASQEDLKLVIIDYLQLMRASRRIDSREQEISEISRTLKSIAKEFDLPVIALSQLNRRVEQRGDNKRPQMSDLRESGAIEQDADIICFIYREEVYNPDTPDKGTAEIIVAKHRNGPTDTIKLAWRPELTRFESLA